MDQKYGEFVGVDSIHYAEVTVDTDAAYTVGTPKYLCPAAEIAGKPEVSNKTTYYDNKAANNYVTEGKTEMSIITPNLPAEVEAEILGKYFDATDGRVYDGGQAQPKMYALGYRFDMGVDGARYYWFLKGNFSAGEESASSKTNDVDPKTRTFIYTAVTTTHKWTVNGKETSLKRVYGDTANTAFDETDWFDAVQVPVVTP